MRLDARRDGQATKEELGDAMEEFSACHGGVVLEVDQAIRMLLQLGVCFNMEGHPDVYIFPIHIQVKKRGEVWKHDDRMQVYVGRRLACVTSTDIISPGVFPLVQTAVTLKIDRQATIWKDGIKLVRVSEGRQLAVEGLVECVATRQAIDVVVRGPSPTDELCIILLEDIISLISQVLDQRSSGTHTELQYLSCVHLKRLEQSPLAYSQRQIEDAAKNGPSSIVRASSDIDSVAETLRDLRVSLSSEIYPQAEESLSNISGLSHALSTLTRFVVHVHDIPVYVL